jgi:hypothetical protein
MNKLGYARKTVAPNGIPAALKKNARLQVTVQAPSLKDDLQCMKSMTWPVAEGGPRSILQNLRHGAGSRLRVIDRRQFNMSVIDLSTLGLELNFPGCRIHAIPPIHNHSIHDVR